MEISTALKNINEKNNQDKTTPAAVYEEGESMSAIKAVPHWESIRHRTRTL